MSITYPTPHHSRDSDRFRPVTASVSREETTLIRHDILDDDMADDADRGNDYRAGVQRCMDLLIAKGDLAAAALCSKLLLADNR